MQVSANTPFSASYDVAVAKKVQQSTEEQGQQALQLLEAAAPPHTTLRAKSAGG